MPKLTVIYWRDIPAQVIAQKGRTRVKKEMPRRFALAIDRAAMRAGRGSSDAYLEEWRRESRNAEGEMEALLSETVAELEAQFPPDVLEKTTKAGGVVKPED